jgi:dimethylargininase
VSSSPLAFTRDVPDAFAAAMSSGAEPGTLDPARARIQHRAYRAALEAGGFTVVALAADEAHPDCPFVEDTAVIIGAQALATRPGHPDRRGEVPPVAAALARHVPVEWMEAPARLDGGDVLQMGPVVFAGRSDRTDDAGIEALERFVGPLGRTVVPVDVTGVLHLRSAVSVLDGRRILVFPGAVDIDAFAECEVVAVPGNDPGAANVIRLPDGSLLVNARFDDLVSSLIGVGVRTVGVDISEFMRADAGLTCLSLRLRSPLAAPPTYPRTTTSESEP